MRELLFQHTAACEFRPAEDATANADHARHQRVYVRPATLAERTLAAALGLPESREGSVITVAKATPAVRRRVAYGAVMLDRLATEEEIRAATPADATPPPRRRPRVPR